MAYGASLPYATKQQDLHIVMWNSELNSHFILRFKVYLYISILPHITNIDTEDVHYNELLIIVFNCDFRTLGVFIVQPRCLPWPPASPGHVPLLANLTFSVTLTWFSRVPTSVRLPPNRCAPVLQIPRSTVTDSLIETPLQTRTQWILSHLPCFHRSHL